MPISQSISTPGAFTFDECGNGTEARTAYPAVPGGFPPVTFFALNDAITYAMSFSPKHGACICPALSFRKHYPDTVRS
jgi:hypothetical protein